jgi:tetratricopeptide (TPR) repeat protein
MWFNRTVNRIVKFVQSLRNRSWLFGLLLVVVTVLAYLPALRGQFVWDDLVWTTGISGLLQDFSGLRLMWSKFTALQQYYPLSGTTFWLDYHLWGFWPLPYHVENVFLHAGAALLFWKLLRRLQVPGAWLAAAIFALHPVMVESAGWIAERKNVLSLVFYLGALLAYGQYAQWMTSDQRQGTGSDEAVPVADLSRFPRYPSFFYGLAFVLFLGALLAKTTAFSLPAVVLLICWWKHGRIRWRADVLPTLPFFVLAIGLCLVTAWLEKNRVGAQGPDFAMTFPERCLIAGRAPWFYIGKLLWPANLCIIYPRWQLDAGSLGQWLYPISAGIALFVLWLARKRIGRGPATAAFFFIGTLLPVLGFMNAYYMRYSFVCDHWTYLSSLGLIALGAALVARAAEYLHAPAVLYGFMAIVLPVLALFTWQQGALYADHETLWRTTIARNPNAFLAYNNLGVILSGKGQVDEAALNFKKALEIKPDYTDAHYNLGRVLAVQGKMDEAVAHFQKAIDHPDDAKAHYDLGVVLGLRGRLDEGVEQYRKAIAIKPDYADAHGNLANVLAAQGRSDEAVKEYQRTLELVPDSAQAHFRFGQALQAQRNFEAAVREYQKALDIAPGHLPAHLALAWLLATSPEASLRDGNKAVELGQQAEQLAGGESAQILDTLAAAYAEAGRYGEAVDTAKQALNLNATQNNKPLAEAIQARLKLYEAGSPYHQKP